MKHLFIIATIAAALSWQPLQAASLTFDGTSSSPIAISPEASTGLEAIYVLDAASGVTASYTASSPTADVTWTKYGSAGGAFGTDITFTRTGAECSVVLDGADCGFVITDAGRQHCFWVVDYDNHRLEIESVSVLADDSDCASVALSTKGTGDRITYYTITGRPMHLDRDLQLCYSTMTFDESTHRYVDKETVTSYEWLQPTLHVEAPLCDTQFILTGDRFLRQWHMEESATSTLWPVQAVEATTWAVQADRDSENEIKVPVNGLGGSGPIDITFGAAVTDAAVFRQWEIAADPEFSQIENTYTDLDISLYITRSGTTYVRFTAADASGECQYVGPVYEVFVGESKLECPNAFSPGTSPGTNDEWRVSYKSIVSFECHIFNRWGAEMISFNDPAQGWDGTYHGKLVPTGVYYYVIKARGADGVDYNLAGDINIIGYRTGTGQSPAANE